MALTPGQPIVWTYHPQYARHTVYLVAAEVVQTGSLRARMRMRDTQGQILYRWVKPTQMRPRLPDEPVQPYPCRGKPP